MKGRFGKRTEREEGEASVYSDGAVELVGVVDSSTRDNKAATANFPLASVMN